MDLPDDLTTEASHSASRDLDRMSPLEIVELMCDEDRSVVAAVAAKTEAIAAAVAAVGDRLAAGGRLFYVGAGTSGRLGMLDAAECPPTFNTHPDTVQGLIAGGEGAVRTAVEGAEDSADQGATDLRQRELSRADVVVGIAASGFTPYVRGAIDHARAVQACTIAITCNEASPLADAVDHPIVVVVGPEIVAGSTRLKAGTATKMVLNMLSTGAMVRLGKTYGNLMVDLQATNSKLRTRTVRLLRRLTDLGEDAATELLATCDGELKTAVVVARRDVSPEEARARLRGTGGQLRCALEG